MTRIHSRSWSANGLCNAQTHTVWPSIFLPGGIPLWSIFPIAPSHTCSFAHCNALRSLKARKWLFGVTGAPLRHPNFQHLLGTHSSTARLPPLSLFPCSLRVMQQRSPKSSPLSKPVRSSNHHFTPSFPIFSPRAETCCLSHSVLTTFSSVTGYPSAHELEDFDREPSHDAQVAESLATLEEVEFANFHSPFEREEVRRYPSSTLVNRSNSH